MDRFLPATEFKRLARIGREAGAGIAIASAGVRAVDQKARTATFVFSDESIDRSGDRIMASGWQLRDFQRNPVALFGHNSGELPIGRAINVHIAGPRLIGSIFFAPAETSPFADKVFRMVVGGFVSAVSVGFLPIQYRWAQDPARPAGIDFLRQSLLEISVVTVPANQGALLVGAGLSEQARANEKRRRTLEFLRLRDAGR
jgi:HK97 family phage prohead protease